MATVTGEMVGKGGVDTNGKPVFIATNHKRYMATSDRQLTDQEQLHWKVFQLYKATLSVERRDSVYQSLTTSDFANYRLTEHILGTPFPVIEHEPSVWDCFNGLRWYEHTISASIGVGYNYWIRSKPSLRHVHIRGMSRSATLWMNVLATEMLFMYRSFWRLTGVAPNDAECKYFGVLEDSTRLKQKADLWAKYAAYKEEWCRRWDYHVFGIRPGERFSLFSACMLPPKPILFNTTTDYPMRKNPYFLSTTPLRDMFLENPFITHLPQRVKDYPLAQVRPEVAQLYHGPDSTPAERTK